MSVKWKNKKRFKPEVILEKIDTIRNVDAEGTVSFTAFEIEHYLTALHSMLEFPDAASELSTSELIFRSLAKVDGVLSPSAFLKSINEELSTRLATNLQTYNLLTAISLDNKNLPTRLSVGGSQIRFLPGNYPTKFASRNELLRLHPVSVADPPATYCKVIVTTQAKTPKGATNRALRSLDAIRAILCLLHNPRMQIAFGNAAISPINKIRLGSKHTLHLENGKPAIDTIWFEPGFKETSITELDNADIFRYSSRVLRQLGSSSYGDSLIGALIHYVRAFDESDPNTAFIRLWGALEMLTTPTQADHGQMVSRCSFLYQDPEFHRQLLEHLREYRNANVHAWEESEEGRTHCFQLQFFFLNVIRFHLSYAKYFRSLDEANRFLDSPLNVSELSRRSQLMRMALSFRNKTNSGRD